MPWRTENRACRPKGPNLPRPRRTERPCGATGEAAGEKWSIFRWSRRTRRTTKGHEDCQNDETADYGRTQRLTEGNRGTQRRAAATAGRTARLFLEITKNTKDTKKAAPVAFVRKVAQKPIAVYDPHPKQISRELKRYASYCRQLDMKVSKGNDCLSKSSCQAVRHSFVRNIGTEVRLE